MSSVWSNLTNATPMHTIQWRLQRVYLTNKCMSTITDRMPQKMISYIGKHEFEEAP